VTELAVEGLVKRFGRVTAVDGVSFAVRSGRVTGFLGPNGAGKTTTLRMILGLVRPTAGTALFDGHAYDQLEEPLRTVGAVLEQARAHPGRSGRDHLRVLCSQARLPAGRADEVLRLVDLTGAADRRAGGYSLGMRQRLGLAAALLGDPGVLILDEPANGLDPQGIRWLRDVLRAQAAAGRTVLVSSHQLQELALAADDVVVLHRGRLVAQGPVAQLAGSRRGGVRVRCEDPVRLADALSVAGGVVATPFAAPDGRDVGGDALRVERLDAAAVGRVARDEGIALRELTESHANLEEVFLELTREAT